MNELLMPVRVVSLIEWLHERSGAIRAAQRVVIEWDISIVLRHAPQFLCSALAEFTIGIHPWPM